LLDKTTVKSNRHYFSLFASTFCYHTGCQERTNPHQLVPVRNTWVWLLVRLCRRR